MLRHISQLVAFLRFVPPSHLPDALLEIRCKVPSFSCPPRIVSSKKSKIINPCIIHKISTLWSATLLGCSTFKKGTVYSYTAPDRSTGVFVTAPGMGVQKAFPKYRVLQPLTLLHDRTVALLHTKIAGPPRTFAAANTATIILGTSSHLLFGAQASEFEVQCVHVLLGVLPCRQAIFRQLTRCTKWGMHKVPCHVRASGGGWTSSTSGLSLSAA